MQIMLDTTTFEDRDWRYLRALATFIGVLAALEAPPESASTESPINSNGKADPIVLTGETIAAAAADFKASESLPPDNVDKGIKAAPAPIPLPPNVAPVSIALTTLPPLPPPSIAPLDVLAAQHTAGIVTRLSADQLPPMPLPPGPPPAPEFDKHGVAYDANLHSSTRSQTLDGKWKARRNRGAHHIAALPGDSVPAGTNNGTLRVEGVKVEPGQEAAAIAAYVAGKATPIPIPLPPTGIPAPPASVAPQADDDIEVEADATAAPGMDFPTFISLITAGMNAGTVSQAKITEVMAAHKLDSLFSLNTKPDLVPTVARDFGFA